MRHLEVLVFTKNTTTPNILNWNVSTVTDVETAIEKLQQRPYKVVAISEAMSNSDKMKLNRLISIISDTMIVVNYNEGTDLAQKVKTAYWSKNKPGAARQYLDNAFEIQLANSIYLN
ncbi:hypothetical protein [Psychroserpens sp. SPM9]|uniref:hypothetical protein n=1 Tax=Psychroserpens sp. SPM9 TaxID=2975598 RepID=UPI0021A66694|nr:hypothetical protein [Psychroserpens sp. SPM9]MDG5491581.1 hypothetical protein [Psychroserpens sp. SPM9]